MLAGAYLPVVHGSSPDWPVELLLVRHGESAGNVARDDAELRGLDRIHIDARRDPDVPLSPLGEQQAEALGRWLSEQPPGRRPTAVLASPYVRAFRTAGIALRAAGLSEVPLRIDERLRERELGVLDRLTRRGIEHEFPEQARLRSTLGKFYHRPPGGESWCDVILRLRSVLETVSRELRGERVLIVCHSAVVLCFRYLLEQMTEEQILAVDRAVDVANCSVTSYALEGERLALRRFNFVAPLRERGAKVTTEPDAAPS
jgi:probable phosphoglycerate mutase